MRKYIVVNNEDPNDIIPTGTGIWGFLIAVAIVVTNRNLIIKTMADPSETNKECNSMLESPGDVGENATGLCE